MIKTPEEMAEEYASKIYQLKYYVDGRRKHSQGQEGLRWLAGKNGFLAGYKAAQDTYKDAISTYEKVAKQMLEEAVRIMSPQDQLADADKVMCNTTMEEIKTVDTGNLMPVTNFLTPGKWISVKDRLPEVNTDVLVKVSKGWVESDDNGNNPKPLTYDFYSVMSLYYENNQHVWDTRPVTDACPLKWEDITHWMPLPAPPKEEK